jgi:cytochrome c-type biogenesis protein CcmE
MTMTTDRKLVVGGVIVAGLIAYLAYRGATASWQYYLTADECRAESASLTGHRLRVSGRIAAGTLALERDRSRASFALEADGANLNVVCSGPLPDNLADGIAVLVEGRLDASGLLRGDKVLTRCASKYESRLPATVAQSPPAVDRQSAQPTATMPCPKIASKPGGTQ